MGKHEKKLRTISYPYVKHQMKTKAHAQLQKYEHKSAGRAVLTIYLYTLIELSPKMISSQFRKSIKLYTKQMGGSRKFCIF